MKNGTIGGVYVMENSVFNNNDGTINGCKQAKPKKYTTF
jgi:hypothetical protein